MHSLNSQRYAGRKHVAQFTKGVKAKEDLHQMNIDSNMWGNVWRLQFLDQL